MLSLFDLLTKKELTMQEQGYLRDRLAILEAQRIPRGQGNLEMWGNLTVNSSGSAVVGEGQANRLMVWSDEHTAGISYGLTTVGDLIHMAADGANDQVVYFANDNISWPEDTLETIKETFRFTNPPKAGSTVSILIDFYSGYSVGGFGIIWRIRKNDLAGTVLTTHVASGTNAHADHWAETVVDATPGQTYVLTSQTTVSGTGLSDYRSIILDMVSADPIPARLPIGSEDQFLRVASGLPVWESVSVITSVSDTASVDLTQTGAVLSADVIPGGVDHNSLANLTAGDPHTQYLLNSLLTTRGDIIRRGASAPERYGLVVPAAGVLNYLGVANGETDPSWKSASSNPGAAASILASNNDGHLRLERLGIMGGNPFYGIHVGTGTSNSSDAQIVIARAIDDGTAGNGHAFSDSSTITRSGGVSYNSFDGRIKVNGSANYGHFATFQNAPIYNTSGTITDTYGFVILDEIQQGTITNRYGVYIADIVKTGGTVTTNKGIYIAPLANGSTNWSIYQDGNNNSWFSGKIGMGITPIYKLYIAGDANGEATIGLKAYSVSNLTKLRLVSSGNTDYGGITGNSSTGEVRFGAEHASFFLTLYAGNAERLRIDTAGKVGIGGTPSYKLHVIGTADIQQFVVKNNATQTINPFELHPSGSTTPLAYITPTGGAVFNEGGDAGGDVRMESDTEVNMFLLDPNGNTDGTLHFGGVTNGIQIDKGGRLTFNGTATYWKDIAPYSVATGSGPSAPALAQYGTTGHYLYKFADNHGTDEALTIAFQMPHEWKIGSDVHFHVHVIPSANGSAGNNQVIFRASYQWVNIDGSFSTTTNTDLDTTFTVGASDGNAHKLWEPSALSGSGKTLSGGLVITLTRLSKTNPGGADNYTGDVWLLFTDCHCECDAVGSADETSK